MASATAVVRAIPDGYDMAKPALMGRQSAGHGFLRAAVQARAGRPIRGLSPTAAYARGFEAIVKAIDPQAPFEWIPTDEIARVADTGVLYLADSTLASHSRSRLRSGLGAFSLCGVTHTTASQLAMTEIVGLLREPIAPWDALVCTSTSVVETIRRVHEAESDYLRWRFGPGAVLQGPQLPIIPLGVHCDDFIFTEAQREGGRAALGLEPDEVVALFVGRLVYHAKAHPFAMYRGLQEAARRTGKQVTLILCGWAPSDAIADVFRTGAAAFGPEVRLMFVEGRNPVPREHAWAASDIFVSLSDNIQETFGLTPIEAMAAGMPVVVTDWDGYRDTVRQGVDGFRITTWAPEPGMGQPLAAAYEDGSMNYDRYCGTTAAVTAIDLAELTEALTALVANPAMRHTMGAAGRRRAREVYDWAVVYRQYEALWAELNARRQAALADPASRARLAAAPKVAATGLDPFEAFGHYATSHIGPATPLSLDPDAGPHDLQARIVHGLFTGAPNARAVVEAVYAAIAAGAPDPATIATRLAISLPKVIRCVGQLAKMGMVKLG